MRIGRDAVVAFALLGRRRKFDFDLGETILKSVPHAEIHTAMHVLVDLLASLERVYCLFILTVYS